MNERPQRLILFLKLLAVFVVGFLLWKCALLSLNWVAQQSGINPLWMVALSRFALLGYLLPFVAWLYFDPQKIFAFRFGDTEATIWMPFIWYGVRDNVLRVSIIFSLLCLICASIFFYTHRPSATVLWAGFAFAVVNALLEELLWRGFILSRTIQIFGEKLGLLWMALAFGLYHYPLGYSLPICLLFSLGGVYFGGITVRSKGLLLGTAMHISMNILFVAMGIIF